MGRHGVYKNVHYKDRILNTEPRHNFNAEGVQRLGQLVQTHVPSNESWCLFERPGTMAALTPEATEALADVYASLEAFGCVAIAVEVPAVFAHGLIKRFEQQSSLPIKCSEDASELELFLQQHLPA